MTSSRYCEMCDKRVKGKECPLCGADTRAIPRPTPRAQHTCHDMQPPFAGPCGACEQEQAAALASPVYPTAIHADNPEPIDLMDALRRALPNWKAGAK